MSEFGRRSDVTFCPNDQASCFNSNCSDEVIESISDVDCLLWAVGRRPLIEGIGLESVGVELQWKGGYIKVDEYQNTSTEGGLIGDALEQKRVCITPYLQISHSKH